MKITILVLLLFSHYTYAIKCDNPNKTVICHAGSVNNPNYVNICVDFAALWGHFAHHSLDMYGPCPTVSEQPYACNAGIKHEKSKSTICYQVDNNQVVENCNNSENCICSYTKEDQHRLDYMKFQFKNRTTNEVDSRTIQAKELEYATAFSNYELGKFEINSETLKFNLGSERIGSQYFVDLCIENQMSDPSKQKQIMSSLTMYDGVLTQSNYVQQTDLKIKSQVFCHDPVDQFADVYNFLISENSYRNYQPGGLYIYPIIPQQKLCVLRYTFKENEMINHMRKWTHQNVKANTFLDTYEDLPADEPIQICHVKKVSNKSYQCQNLRFDNGEDYIQYILTYNNVRAWRQDHQHDYRGYCQSPCAPLRN